jgi:hypothetical protein
MWTDPTTFVNLTRIFRHIISLSYHVITTIFDVVTVLSRYSHTNVTSCDTNRNWMQPILPTLESRTRAALPRSTFKASLSAPGCPV